MQNLTVPPPISPTLQDSAFPSRKRQRTTSLNSATPSTSPKRAASEDPSSQDSATRSLTAQSSSIPSVSDNADAHMASTPPTSPPSLPEDTPRSDATQPTAAMSNELKLQKITELRKEQMRKDQTWYLVAKPWLNLWEKAMTGAVDKEGGVEEKDIGSVDNSALVNHNGDLSTNPVEGIDVEFVPEEAWNHFVSWYGEPQYPLPRTVIMRGIARTMPSLELHPPRFRIYRLVRKLPSGPAGESPERHITVSSGRTSKDFCREMAEIIDPTSVDEYRVWTIHPEVCPGGDYSLVQLRESKAKLLEPGDEDIAEIDTTASFAIEFIENGQWMSDPLDGAYASSSNVVPPPLFGQSTDFFSSNRFQSDRQTATGSTSSSSFLKPAAPVSVPSTTRQKSIDPGTLGLGNMGNTCFMNSALQCLAHIPELSDYFTTGIFNDELNPDNPLGMGGAIAESFGALLSRMWSTSSPSSSYSPREFKQVLARFAPQFSGYQQHDSQELVAFLLDGLHEDLNRVLKKPYVEKPDWEGGGNLEVFKLAKDSWDGYMRRNDSVIVDLFQGQYRSTLICPECSKVSITFDPFMYLTLPIPVRKKWRHKIKFIPHDPSKPHLIVPVEVGRDSSFKEVRQLLGRWLNVPSDNLLLMEIFSHKFYKNLDDTVLVSDMSDTDHISCYELPCHARQARTYKRSTSEDEPFIIPVFLTDTTPPKHYNFNRNTPSLFGQPFFLVITQEDARSLERIEELVVEQLSRWTKCARDLYSWESNDSPMEEVHIPVLGGPVADAIAEIQENGDIVTVQEPHIEEGDIVDEKSMMLDDVLLSDPKPHRKSEEGKPRRVGVKQGAFTMRLQINLREYGSGFSNGIGVNATRFEQWEERKQQAAADLGVDDPVLLTPNDGIVLEFDENMKAYFFGEDKTWEQALFSDQDWQVFTHEEYAEAERASKTQSNKGISLHDCLTEFTKEEQLGEDDLWYCPTCKKHQQATKKFDLWSVPDVLVVHLKRFSNSRTLRDKIDTFVDFPLTDLDLTEMSQERQVAKELQKQGIDVSQLGLGDLDEPLVYDLCAVDEHLGGLGGGHYRAYSYNHITDKWYHFDDSYVTEARPVEAINANAYLLVYRRRTARPLGGTTHAKIEAARARAEAPNHETVGPVTVETQLPTPPNEPAPPALRRRLGEREHSPSTSLASTNTYHSTRWATPQSASSPSSSPPPLDDGEELPSYGDVRFDGDLQTSLDPLALASRHYDFPSSKASPTSSNEVELDSDDELTGGRKKRWEPLEDEDPMLAFGPTVEWEREEGMPEVAVATVPLPAAASTDAIATRELKGSSSGTVEGLGLSLDVQ